MTEVRTVAAGWAGRALTAKPSKETFGGDGAILYLDLGIVT